MLLKNAEHIADLVSVRRRCSPVLAVSILVAAVAIGGCQSSSTITETPTGPSLAKCQMSLGAPSIVDSGGGTGTIGVTTAPECAWAASTTASWISGLSPASGQGNGTVEFRVAPNDATAAREADILVNENRVRVSQRAACRYDVTPSSHSITAAGGAGSVNIAAPGDCAWTAAADVSWISLAQPLSGSGNGTVSFTVAANGGAERTGNVVAGGQRSSVTQAAIGTSTACTFTITPTSQNIGAGGGGGTSVSVATQSGCRWTAGSNASWITVTSGATGTGNGSVGFNVAANTGGARTGTLTIATRTFTVTQAAGVVAPSCNYSISPNDQKFEAGGGTGTVSVSTGSGCTWTASSNESWITVISGASGTGNGTVTFRVDKNEGKPRKGTLTVAGKTFTVDQNDQRGK